MTATDREPIKEVTIYVRRRKIRRSGKIVDGWQAGFQPKSGGPTSTSREVVIEYQRQVALKAGQS